MPPKFNPGTRRQFWLRPLTNTSNTELTSFILREDAASKQGAQFGRNVRLGDPISLGPNSAWRQLSWEGGVRQEDWRDRLMFQEGSADTRARSGKLTLHNGWKALITGKRSQNRYTMVAAPVVNEFGTASELLVGEGHQPHWPTSTYPTGGYRIVRINMLTGVRTPLPGGPNNKLGVIQSLVPAEQGESANRGSVFVATSNALWQLVYGTGAWGWLQDTNCTVGINTDSMVAFNGNIYYGSYGMFRRRTPVAPYGVLGTHTDVKQHNGALRVSVMTVWNNRIWYAVQYPRSIALYSSDGNVSQRAVDIPNDFFVTSIAVHYGHLYIGGLRPTPGDSNKGTGQVWRFSGSSLTLLWEGGDPAVGGHASVTGMVSHGPALYWTVSGTPAQSAGTDPAITYTPRACIMGYDPVSDAIFEGPGVPVPSGVGTVAVAGLASVGGVLIAHFMDTTLGGPHPDPNGHNIIHTLAKYQTGGLKRNDFQVDAVDLLGGASFDSVDDSTVIRSEFITSSKYHGEEDVSSEDKTWLGARLRLRIPLPDAQVRLVMLTEGGRSEVPIGTVHYDATQVGWRTATLPMRASVYAQAVLADTPVGYWRLDERTASSTTVQDLGSATPTVLAGGLTGAVMPRNGVAVGTPTREVPGTLSDDPNNAYTFDGSSQYVQIADADDWSVFRSGVPGSMECWFNPSTSPLTDQSPVAKGTTAAFEWSVLRNGVVTSFVVRNAAGSSIANIALGSTAIGTWYHLVVTWDGTTARTYVNGVAGATSTLSGTYTPGTGMLNIGRRADASQYFPGSVDEVAIYATQLSAARVLAHYNAGVNSPPYLSANTVQYKLYLENTSTSLTSTASVDVDSVEVTWLPKPGLRRTWRYTAICQDSDTRLDDSANPVTTGAAMSDFLQSAWANRTPYLLWEARTATTTPVPASEAGIEVFVTEFLEQSFRISSDSTETGRYVQVTFTEHIR